MAKRDNRNDWGVLEMAREKPLAATAAAAGAAAAGLFLWSKRAQISEQISSLSDQIGEWKTGYGNEGDTAGLPTGVASERGMSETGGGNASLGRQSGGGEIGENASSRGRAKGIPSTT